MKIKFEKTHDVYEDRFFFFMDWLDKNGHGLKKLKHLMQKPQYEELWNDFQEVEYAD